MSEISKAVLITGCSTGIGRATALRLAKAGWTVYATARNLDSIKDLADAGCKTLALDVNDPSWIKLAVDTIEEKEGVVGVLINNAGYSQSGAVESVSMDDVRRQFETNVFGLTELTQHVLPGMRKQGWGKIVNISSIGGKLVFPGGGFYHATKHAVEAISDALRFEVQNFGVDVIIVEPGLIRTDFANNVEANIDAALLDGPYGEFNAAVLQGTVEVYEKGAMAKLGGDSDSVAQVIEKAINANRPKTRYTVTPSAKLLLGIRKLLSDRMWDGFCAGNFKRPGS
jgi:NADP-dependent 3-hydroxy acid dehydrogenase YdfG